MGGYSCVERRGVYLEGGNIRNPRKLHTSIKYLCDRLAQELMTAHIAVPVNPGQLNNSGQGF